jgi:hypothetical protein
VLQDGKLDHLFDANQTCELSGRTAQKRVNCDREGNVNRKFRGLSVLGALHCARQQNFTPVAKRLCFSTEAENNKYGFRDKKVNIFLQSVVK